MSHVRMLGWSHDTIPGHTVSPASLSAWLAASTTFLTRQGAQYPKLTNKFGVSHPWPFQSQVIPLTRRRMNQPGRHRPETAWYLQFARRQWPGSPTIGCLSTQRHDGAIWLKSREYPCTGETHLLWPHLTGAVIRGQVSWSFGGQMGKSITIITRSSPI